MPIVLSGSYQKFYNQLASPVSQSYVRVGKTKFANFDLMNFTHGEFSRTTSGSVTLGTSSSLGWANPSARRIEDRGDGLAPLFEGGRVNLIVRNRELTNAAWTISGFRSASATSGPDGASGTGTYITGVNPDIGNRIGAGLATVVTPYALSTYVRSLTGTQPWSIALSNGAFNQCYNGRIGSNDTTWQRQDMSDIPGADTFFPVVGDCAALTRLGVGQTITALNRSGVYDLVQFEEATFPSSPIVTAGSATSRTADVLRFNASDVPTNIRNGAFSFDVLPYFSNTEISGSTSGSQNIYTLLSFGDNDYLAISGSKLLMSASTGFAMSGALTSSALAWNRHQKLTFTVDARSGVIDVANPTGSFRHYFVPWSWSNTGLQIGAMSGSSLSSSIAPFYGRISNFRAARSPVALDIFTGGTHTRSTEASFLINAATNGAVPFLTYSATNGRRIENRGDNFNNMLLKEGARTNLCLHSETFSNAAWSTSLLTVADDTVTAPDGVSDADTLQFTASAVAEIFQQFSSVPANNATAVCSVWLRAATSQTVRLLAVQKDGSTETAATSCAVTTTWQRFEMVTSVGTGAFAPYFKIRNHTDAAARDVYAWGAQIECSAATCQFPTSYIRTTTVAVTRALDVLSYAVGQYPESFLTRGFRIRWAFDCTDTELVNAGSAMYPVSFGAGVWTTRVDINRVIYCDTTGGGGTSAFTSVTWSRGQVLTLEFRPSLGTITLSGATTGNATIQRTPWSYPNQSLAIGSTSGTAQVFGRFIRYIEAL